jgi:hypothetical protein
LPLDLLRTVEIANQWGVWDSEQSRWDRASQAFRYGLVALHRTLQGVRGRLRTSDLLLRSLDLSSRAAFALTAVGDYIGAVVALEKGRTILSFGSRPVDGSEQWFDDIWGTDAETIVSRFREARQRFADEDPLGAADIANDNLFGMSAAFHRVANAVWQEQRSGALILRSATRDTVLGEVAAAARDGPIVYLLASTRGGLALIVNAQGDLQVQPLDELNEDRVRPLVEQFYLTYDLRDEGFKGFRRAIRTVSEWLGTAIFGELKGVCRPGGRLVLVPTGQMGLLPLAIAALSGPEQESETEADDSGGYALDAWELTTAPTAAAYCDALEATSRRSAEEVLVVDDPQPLPDGFQSLLASHAECEVVRQAFTRTTDLVGTAATKDRVMGALRGHGVVHFSCHGLADPADPWATGLVLSGDMRLQARDLGEQELGETRLIVLSACESAVVGQHLPDEAIGLPVMFLAAGAPGVIGTLWTVSGPATLMVMLWFYRLWRKEHRHPAAALRAAQVWVRDSTNGEKLGAISQSLPAAFLASDPYSAELIAYLAKEPQKRAFTDPYFWGGFVYVGA